MPEGFERWDGKRWPPRDPITRLLEGIVDAEPRGEWMTSNERVREAERLRDELAKRGYVIVRKTDAS